MRPRPRQPQLRFRHAVNQHPVWLDVQVAIAEPLTLERMIAVAWFERCVFNQQQDHRPQFGQILAAFLAPLGVFAKRG